MKRGTANIAIASGWHNIGGSNAMKRGKGHLASLVQVLFFTLADRASGFGRSSHHSDVMRGGRTAMPSPVRAITSSPSRLHAATAAVENGSGESSTATPTRSALSMTIDELSEALGGKGRARLAWDCYAEGADPHYLFGSALPADPLGWGEYGDRELLKKNVLPTPRQTQPLGGSALSLLSDIHSHCHGRIENGLATLVHVSTSSDGTTKLLLRLIDGWEVETVLIPFWADGNHKNNIRNNGNDAVSTGRTTVCISSQVGCRQGCTFCATGKMGKLRSLTTDEILAQLFFAKKIVRLSGDGILRTESGDEREVELPAISNIVFMGMGEPADNAEAVRGAIKIMTQNDYFQLSASRVTVSTVAPEPSSFGEFADSRCVLAWSVHAARDELRKQLVPTTKYKMEELRGGLIDALKRRSLRTCMVEVALMDGINDSLREADELAEFVSHVTREVPGSKLICNLIPFNDIGSVGLGYRKPPLERVLAFQRRLQELGVYAHVRGTRGDDESAACGQLVTSRKKKELDAAV